MEEAESSFWLRFWALFVILGLVITVTIGMYYYEDHKQFIEAGYEEVAIPGHGFPVWQKKDCN